jgi:hypothetical protein
LFGKHSSGHENRSTDRKRLLREKLQHDFLRWADDALDLDAQTPQDLPRIREVIAKYRDLPADFADASLVALAERRGLFVVASIDKDFTVYRGASRRRFRNVFFA